MPQRFSMLIDGRLVGSEVGFEIFDPATGALLARCPRADSGDFETAVAAATRTLDDWSARSLSDRAGLIDVIVEQLTGRVDEFARLLAAERGLSLAKARSGLQASILSLEALTEMSCESGVRRPGCDGGPSKQRALRGVCAISPSDFPFTLLVNMLGVALLAGNTVIATSAPGAPLTTLLLGEILQAELPAGVANILADAHDPGTAMAARSGIAGASLERPDEAAKNNLDAAANAAAGAGDRRRARWTDGCSTAAPITSRHSSFPAFTACGDRMAPAPG